MSKVLASVIAALCCIVAVPSWAPAQDDWTVYRNDQFAMQISYPASLFDTVEETGEGITILGPDARLDLAAREVPGLASASQLRGLMEQAEGYDDVTYSPGGNRWLVVSGYRGPDIFYEKFFLSKELVRGFSLQYPAALRRLYDPVVERMEDSFRVEPL